MIRKDLTDKQKQKVIELLSKDIFFYSEIVHKYLIENSRGCARVSILDKIEYTTTEISNPLGGIEEKVRTGVKYIDSEKKQIFGKNIHGFNGLVFYSEPDL